MTDYKIIADFLSESAERYYHWLDPAAGHKKITGSNIVEAKAKKASSYNEKSSDYHYVLSFESRIQNFDFVYKLVFNKQEYDISNFLFIEITPFYAIVNATKAQIPLFENSDKIILFLDFRLLVWRIHEKFKYNRNIHYPEKYPSVKFNFNDYAGVPFSEVQKNAINNIHLNPVSYVWGAAGSGKTRFVLAYSVINYLRLNRRVLVTAPTNIALDNAMSEIISLADKYDISRFCIKRLGIPTPVFHQAYPECCSDYKDPVLQALLKKRYLLECYIDEYENRYSVYLSLSALAENAISEYENMLRFSADETALRSKREETQRLLDEANECLKTYSAAVDEINKKRNMFSSKLKRLIMRKDAFSDELKKAVDDLSNTASEIKRLKTLIKNISSDYSFLQIKIIAVNEAYRSYSEQLSSAVSDCNLSLTYDSPQDLKEQLSELITSSAAELEKLKIVLPDVDLTDIDNVKSAAEELSSTIDERTEKNNSFSDNILLFGCTLDRLAVSPSISNVAHVFLDEACYACSAKAAQLFLFDCPITFLGDHMQLPPVSELDDDDLELKENHSLFPWCQSGIYSAALFSLDFDSLRLDYLNNTETLPQFVTVSSLNETHRFGIHLANILNTHVYENGFHSALDTETSIFFIDAPRTIPPDPNKKRTNENEANAIKLFLQSNSFENFAVLTPYNNQRNLLRDDLRDIPDISRDNILTIHKSQGREWDTVILSVVDTNDKWFTDSNCQKSRGKQLLNTAISRAKKNLIIVCDYTSWLRQKDQLISALLQIAKPLNNL